MDAAGSQKKRNSCKAIILENGRLLVVKKVDASGSYFVIPGGGQEWGEELKDALERECIEEIGTSPTEIHQLACIREFIGSRQTFPNANKSLHQVEFYFHCSIDSGLLGAGSKPDDRQEGVEWLEIAELDQARLYPAIIKDIARKLSNKESIHPIYVGAAD